MPTEQGDVSRDQGGLPDVPCDLPRNCKHNEIQACNSTLHTLGCSHFLLLEFVFSRMLNLCIFTRFSI